MATRDFNAWVIGDSHYGMRYDNNENVFTKKQMMEAVDFFKKFTQQKTEWPEWRENIFTTSTNTDPEPEDFIEESEMLI